MLFWSFRLLQRSLRPQPHDRGANTMKFEGVTDLFGPRTKNVPFLMSQTTASYLDRADRRQSVQLQGPEKPLESCQVLTGRSDWLPKFIFQVVG